MDESRRILAELGDRLGLGLSFSEHGQCCLVLDQDLFVMIEDRPFGWAFSGHLRNDVGGQDKAFWQRMLSLNLLLAEQHAGRIAHASEMDVLVYTDTLPGALLTSDSAYEFLDRFVDQLEKLREQIGAQPDASGTKDSLISFDGLRA